MIDIEPSKTDQYIFDVIGQSAEGLTIAYYTAPWCVPCKMYKPRLEEIEAEKGLTIYRIDVESNPERAKFAGIMSVPTLQFWAFGNYVGELVGLKQKKELLDYIDMFKE